MTNLRSILLGSVAAIGLAAAPVIAQQTTTTPAEGGEVAAEQQAMPRNFDDTYGEGFADWGDRNVQELIGTNVASTEGESIGEVDNFALVGEQIAAIVGIGGFLGIGEHQVAMSLGDLTWDGEQLVVPYTEEELRAMPAYDEGGTVLAGDNTFRTGFETDAPTQTAEGAQPTTEGAETETTTVQVQPAEGEEAETAEATQPATEGEQPAETAEAAQPATEGEQPAETAEAAQPATEGEQPAETAEAAQPATEGEQPAETAEAAQPATEGAETETAEAGAEAEQVADEAEAEMAEGEAAQPAAEGETEMAEGGAWNEQMDTVFADIADVQVAELIGIEVAGADGQSVGEIDNFALMGEEVVAVVGVGGFLGLGEHLVALPLSDMTYDGERLVLSSLTEEQLREMPEYDEAAATVLPEDQTLRNSYSQ